MKKTLSLILVLLMCLSLCACSEKAENTAEEDTKIVPTVETVAEGIKNEFKDPESVQVSDGSWAYVKEDGEEVGNEFYVICTVRAKNSFGGYANPQAYVVHFKNGNYKLVEEYNDESFKTQVKFNELGCGAQFGLH